MPNLTGLWHEYNLFYYSKLVIAIFAICLVLANSFTYFAVPNESTDCRSDKSHIFFSFLHDYLKTRQGFQMIILSFNSLIADSCLITLIYAFLQQGDTWKPVVRVSLIMAFKLVCSLIFLEKLDVDNLLASPGIPSIVFSYSHSNDLFFCGHIAIIIQIAIELWDYQAKNKIFRVPAILCTLIIPLVIISDLSIRNENFIGIFAGITVALYVTLNSTALIDLCDQVCALDDCETLEISKKEFLNKHTRTRL